LNPSQMMNTTFLTLLSASVYAMAALLQWQTLGNREPRTARHPLALGGIAVSLHALTLIGLLSGPTGFPFTLGSTLSMTTLGICTTIVLVSLRHPLQSLQLAAYPLTIVTLLISLHTHPLPEEAEHLSRPVLLHVALSMVAFILLCVATLQAATLYWQNRQLKKHNNPRLMRLLPPLQTTETLLFNLIWVGLITLTLAIITGSLYVENLFAQKLAHKTAFTLISWFLFSLLLCGRYLWGWRGLLAARLTLIGSALLIIGFVGSKFVLEILLSSNNA
jgi:ABC-type uncharacterized transport system permease subunit